MTQSLRVRSSGQAGGGPSDKGGCWPQDDSVTFDSRNKNVHEKGKKRAMSTGLVAWRDQAPGYTSFPKKWVLLGLGT